jgi:hypothetical protein
VRNRKPVARSKTYSSERQEAQQQDVPQVCSAEASSESHEGSTEVRAVRHSRARSRRLGYGCGIVSAGERVVGAPGGIVGLTALLMGRGVVRGSKNPDRETMGLRSLGRVASRRTPARPWSPLSRGASGHFSGRLWKALLFGVRPSIVNSLAAKAQLYLRTRCPGDFSTFRRSVMCIHSCCPVESTRSIEREGERDA